MEPIRRSTILLVLALGAAAPFAQETADEAGDPPAAEAPEPAAEDDAGPAGAGDVPARRDEDVFVPTEELDADEEVTFPVDI